MPSAQPTTVTRLRAPLAATCIALLVLAGVSACSSAPGPATAPVPSGTSEAQMTSVRTGRDPASHFIVDGTDLGIHSFTTQPTTPTKSIRLNCFPNWTVVEPQRGHFDWSAFDNAVAQAEAWGYTDILYSFCATPKWAGVPVGKEDPVPPFGPGTAQPVANMADFDQFVQAVVTRYKGRISGYEVWNEASSPQFWKGSVPEMVTMTKHVYQLTHQIDPAAYVASASTQTHRADFYDAFFPKYLAGLKAAKWPIDAVSAHFYPDGKGTPADRMKQVAMLQKDLAAAGAPRDIPVWDTEVNYYVGLPGGEPDGRITGDQAAAWTAQTYLDGWRTGVRRSYWYMWTADYFSFPGIQMRPGDASTQALSMLGSWLIGAEYTGCTTAPSVVDKKAKGKAAKPGAAIVDCHFTKDGTAFDVVYTSAGEGTLAIKAGKTACPVYGGTCKPASGQIVVGEMPTRIA